MAKRTTRRNFVAKTAALAGAAVASPALIRVASAQTPQVSLKLHHMLSAMAPGHRAFLAPWADKVMKASEGRIKIDLFPSMQLGGTPPQLYDQVRDGVADFIWTVQGYTANRFPKTEVFELPFVASNRSIVNAMALTEFAEKHLKDEYKEVRPITLWAHDAGLVHAKKPVRTIADLNGMKVRSPTRLAGLALRALGATPVGMPVPQVPESLAQGVIDGCVIPWEVVPAVKVHELVKHHTELPGTPTFYVATFCFAMNPAKYASLPDDLKKIIDAHSGIEGAKMAGTAWDASGPPIRDMVSKRGNEIITLPADEVKKWQAATQPVIDQWLTDAKAKGINGEELLKDARDLIAKYEKSA
jgi:TRAP-type transport system periplasmic protein